ncbi:hypothetical protein COU39_00015 [Candidatus Micrarchaeota archaeon CG10_big_fil_rev_8_21_14_0_10_60_32]|nr:MAG: hypothetical protein COU39_00015 [Candidatus Micrarchaeota archaeon CG10_big_fil_rev_8_21_14_0_10_60_32]PIO01804.1 MAG: hypothetical protein COT58_03165 [Candidatus Micrarchaeota archaeon CG09_land_8_20_14_0_10_60_16]
MRAATGFQASRPPARFRVRLDAALNAIRVKNRGALTPTVTKMAVKVDASKCTGCGLCAQVCPSELFKIEAGKSRFEDRRGYCQKCRACELNCPQSAIKVADD